MIEMVFGSPRRLASDAHVDVRNRVDEGDLRVDLDLDQGQLRRKAVGAHELGIQADKPTGEVVEIMESFGTVDPGCQLRLPLQIRELNKEAQSRLRMPPAIA
ncbi:MAG: hypothetical protein IPF61_06050 [Xanthomonadales bacterium]|nr:hypothetical protein [Xanthomonadales bacterium]